MILRAIRPIVFAAAAVFTAQCNEGCKPAASADAEAAYTAETLACVRKAATREDSRKCRVHVNKKYGLCNKEDWPKISPCDD